MKIVDSQREAVLHKACFGQHMGEIVA
ncbi:uncharacterized protein METZ01_LOCUS100071 [marine metagenome]|uniref:Uncharacterized protein n=1 Tax=marine metagenome TaxID=408172 RepID=A0A381W5K9_9ZZZZ